jgi:hypothetical protein
MAIVVLEIAREAVYQLLGRVEDQQAVASLGLSTFHQALP